MTAYIEDAILRLSEYTVILDYNNKAPGKRRDVAPAQGISHESSSARGDER